MLFQKSLIKEYAEAGTATFLVLCGITLTTQFIRFLGYAAKGSIATDAVFTFLGFSALRYLPVVILVTIFTSILFVLTRCFRDSEMVVWFSSGQSLARWISPTLVYAGPLIFIVAILSLFLTPWAAEKTEEFKRQLQSQDEVSAISPGVFKESKQGDRVFFVDKLAMDLSVVQNIFIYTEDGKESGVTVAQQGYQDPISSGENYLVLEKGRRYFGIPGSAEFKIIEFDKYGVFLESKKIEKYVPNVKARSTISLLRQSDSSAKAELIWRLGFPISAALLALMAIPLSFVSPQTGRSANLLVAILAYLVYSNILNMMQAWVAQKIISPAFGLLAVHLGVTLIIVLLFYLRSPIRRKLVIQRFTG